MRMVNRIGSWQPDLTPRTTPSPPGFHPYFITRSACAAPDESTGPALSQRPLTHHLPLIQPPRALIERVFSLIEASSASQWRQMLAAAMPTHRHTHRHTDTQLNDSPPPSSQLSRDRVCVCVCVCVCVRVCNHL